MMDQPWYEQSGPTKEDGITALKRWFKYEDHSIQTKANEIIEKCVQAQITKYGSLGSYRGWSTFTHKDLHQEVSRAMEEVIAEKNALDIISNNIHVRNWMNYILYRPPDETLGHKSLRYRDAFHSFSEKSNLM